MSIAEHAPPVVPARRRWWRALPWPTLLIIGAFLIAGALAPMVAPGDPYTPELGERLGAPGDGALLGTDSLGRDMLTRLIFGARASLLVVFYALVFGAGVGLVLGMVSGYLGGAVDAVISRTAEALLAFPPIFFGLLFAVTIGAGVRSVVLAVSLVLWARFAQVIRGDVISVKEREFVQLARITGCSHFRILAIHILPNVMGTFMVLISINMGYVILLESVLSFLGAGIPPPTPSWGGMIAEGQNYISSAWWISIVPGVAIVITVLAFNLLGDWMRDRLDPKLRDQL